MTEGVSAIYQTSMAWRHLHRKDDIWPMAKTQGKKQLGKESNSNSQNWKRKCENKDWNHGIDTAYSGYRASSLWNGLCTAEFGGGDAGLFAVVLMVVEGVMKCLVFAWWRIKRVGLCWSGWETKANESVCNGVCIVSYIHCVNEKRERRENGWITPQLRFVTCNALQRCIQINRKNKKKQTPPFHLHLAPLLLNPFAS